MPGTVDPGAVEPTVDAVNPPRGALKPAVEAPMRKRAGTPMAAQSAKDMAGAHATSPSRMRHIICLAGSSGAGVGDFRCWLKKRLKRIFR